MPHRSRASSWAHAIRAYASAATSPGVSAGSDTEKISPPRSSSRRVQVYSGTRSLRSTCSACTKAHHPLGILPRQRPGKTVASSSFGAAARTIATTGSDSTTIRRRQGSDRRVQLARSRSPTRGQRSTDSTRCCSLSSTSPTPSGRASYVIASRSSTCRVCSESIHHRPDRAGLTMHPIVAYPEDRVPEWIDSGTRRRALLCGRSGCTATLSQ